MKICLLSGPFLKFIAQAYKLLVFPICTTVLLCTKEVISSPLTSNPANTTYVIATKSPAIVPLSLLTFSRQVLFLICLRHNVPVADDANFHISFCARRGFHAFRAQQRPDDNAGNFITSENARPLAQHNGREC